MIPTQHSFHFVSLFISVPLINKHVSSAYIMANIRSGIQMAFMEIIKRRGPIIKPCGTPHSTTLVSDLTPSYR